MAKVELRYVHRFKDRHGKVRHYLRAPGRTRVALPGMPGSTEFMAAYAEALGDMSRPPRTRTGTLAALIAAFYGSSNFKRLAPSTQRLYRNMLEQLKEKAADVQVASIDKKAIQRWVDARSDKPEAANNFLKKLRVVLEFAADRDFIRRNPAKDIKRIHTKSDGHLAWSDDDLEAYGAKWGPGTRERLAMALLLYTGQRRSDVVTMAPRHVRKMRRGDGAEVRRIQVVQAKTGNRVAIPLHPVLAAELAATPENQSAFLLTEFGNPFTAAGFGNWFGESCRAAGLERRTAHGLRKTAGRCLAEAGCSAHQIMAILGHKTLAEAERYTRSVQQDRLADDAMSAWTKTSKQDVAGKPSEESVKPALESVTQQGEAE